MTDIMNEMLDSDAALEAMMDSFADASVTKKDKPLTASALMAKHRKALEQLDIDHLLDLQDKMKKAIDSMTANVFLTPAELTPEKLAEIMEELIDQKVIEKLLKVRYEMIREMVFAKISADHEAAEHSDPTHAPGYVKVASLDKKFTREGGRLKSVLDDERMRAGLTEEQQAEIYRPVVIPARIEYRRDSKALAKLIATNPAAMEVFKAAVEPTGYTSSSFHIRELEEGD